MTISNRLFHEIAVGDTASARRVCTDNDLYVFAHASGSLNPLSLPASGETPSQPPLAASPPSCCSPTPIPRWTSRLWWTSSCAGPAISN